MVELRHHQRLVWEGWFPEQAEGWWEEWMRQADQVLDDDELLEAVYEAQGKRRPKSHCRGRKQTPAEVLLRLAVLKHVRNWSFEETEREVRANVVYRQFTRIGAEKVPDAKTLGRLVQALGPAVIQQVHQRLVAVAQEKKVVRGRRLRLDTTVVEANIHYPTDSSLLSDGARVLTRTMKKIKELTGRAGTKLRNRMRTIGHRAMEIARTSRSKGPQVQKKLQQGYRKLLTVTRKVVNQAKRFREDIASGVKRTKDHEQNLVLRALRKDLETMLPRVQQVIRQAKARVLGGNVHVAGKLVSVFEPSTEVIRKGKAGKPTEFGKMLKIQEAENQSITHYEVYKKRPMMRTCCCRQCASMRSNSGVFLNYTDAHK
jgi:IS5 family transposase